ncbi:SNF2 family N-terminal domain-containing protein [Obelidium mucronatum]|nr:SNF2 family N-terminal domain-containing protein [Obelidium mucronatum]
MDPSVNLQQSLIMKAQQLRSLGATEQNNPQYAQLVSTLRLFSQQQQQQQQQQHSSSQQLRMQIQAFKMLAANQSLPAALKQSLFGDIHSPVDAASPNDEDEEEDEDGIGVLFDFSRRIAARVNHRIRLLESLPANLSNEISSTSSEESLKLLQKQQQLRESLYYGMMRNTTLLTSVDRNLYRRQRKITLREARQTEAIEAERRGERERREKARLQEYLLAVLNCGKEILLNGKTQAAKFQKLGQSVVKYHTVIEKEEQKRSQRVSQERLKALKENDEAAYIKLLDEAKDGRIMQILNKTNAYLSNLASAVVTQKDHISSQDQILLDENAVIRDDEPGANVDYYAVAHKISEKVTKQSSLLVGGQLKEYQIKGLEWMISLYNNRLNGILADEMGLGKTIQTISLITYLIEHKKQQGPYLIIIPLATVSNWTHEFEKWAPSISKLVFKGGPDERRRTAQQIKGGQFQVLITTFEYIIREKAVLSKIKWVIDEGHRMKNANSKLSTTLMQYYNTRYRVILTGTPLQNNLPELWALLNFILPKIFNSVKSFDEWFSSPFSMGGSNVELNEEERLLMIKGLHKVLRPFLLRRLKKDVEKELPDKVETIVKCPMSSLQRKITERVKYLRNVGPFDQTNLSGNKALNNLVMQFRKIANHPFVFPEVEALVLPTNPEFTNEMIFRVSGKFELLDRILPKYFRTGHRVLMFFQMTKVMDLMADYFNYREIKFLRLDGAINGESREILLKEFNQPNSEYNIFILSTRAGGLGLNLQTADTVIIFDSDWNPHQDLQAQDRAHRIGQKKEVRILRLITTNSIEEHILAKAQQKLALDGQIIQAGKFDQKTSEKDRDELLRFLLETEKKEDQEDDEDGEELTDEQLNEMLARNPEEVEIFGQMDREREERAYVQHNGNPLPRLIAENELPACYQMDFSKLKPAEADDLLSIKPRDRKDVHYGEVLTEQQFLEAASRGDLHEVEKLTLQRRAAKKASGEDPDGLTNVFDDEDDDSGNADDQQQQEYQDEDDEEVASKPRKAGRPSSAGPKRRGKKSKAEMLANDSISVEEREQLTNISHACLAAVREVTSGSRELRYVATAFESLPSRKSYKDYYDIVQTPICLSDIQKKINGMRYVSLTEFQQDMNLLFTNARAYNAEGTQLHDDTNVLERIFNETFNAHMSGDASALATLSHKRKREDESGGSGEVYSGRKSRKSAILAAADDGDDFDDDGDDDAVSSRRPTKRVKDDSDDDDF